MKERFETPFSLSYSRSLRPDNLFAWMSIAILLLSAAMPFFSGNAVLDSVSLGFLMNATLGVSMLWISMADAPYSLRQTHWVFFLSFFVISPLNQYMIGSWPWGYAPAEGQVVLVNAIVLIWGIVFAVASGRGKVARQEADESNMPLFAEKFTFVLTPLARAVLLAICIVATVALVYIVGLQNMFIRTTSRISMDSTSMSLMIGVCFRAMVFGGFALLFLNARRARKYYGGAAIAGVCLLLTCFPTALARFNVAAIYLGLAILIFPVFTKKRGLFAFALIVGFMLVYPFFDAFKNVDPSSGFQEILKTIHTSLTYGYVSGNYDAFSIMFWCLDYVRDEGLTMGGQLLGSILFFIPRSLWTTKPFPSGELVFSNRNFFFTDMSFAFPFEGYINFGIVGVIFFAIIFGAIVKKLDNRFWLKRLGRDRSNPSILTLYYPFLLCLTFYMLRGAMMNTFTFVFGDLAVMASLVAISNIFLSRKGVANNARNNEVANESPCLDYCSRV